MLIADFFSLFPGKWAAYGLPPVMKSSMKHLGIDLGDPAKPYSPVTPQDHSEIGQFFSQIGLLEKELKKLGLSLGKVSVGILGLAYKKNVGDMRESPAVKVLQILKGKRAKVFAFDPFVPKEKFSKLPLTSTTEELLKKCEVIILATAHDDFAKITPEVLKRAGVKLVIDGRNCLPKDKILSLGIAYKGIGH